jgi:hypothetical protein
MNTFLKIALGFVLGVVTTIGVLYIFGSTLNTEENQLREEIRLQSLKKMKQALYETNTDGERTENEQSFELTLKNGIVKLHTSMSKDSVQILMGRPRSTNVSKVLGDVMETWKYKGTNSYVDEFTIEFTNGKLEAVNQFQDH